MTFKLSNRSLGKLEGVYPDLVATVKRAIEITEVDFGVTAGVRDIETQRKLLAQGRSQTMKSRHLIQDDGYSWAVDLLAYDVDGNACWEHNMYWKIGDAMIKAAKEVGMKNLRWGSSWHIKDVCKPNMTCEQMMDEYIDIRKAEGRKYFLDSPHWEKYE